MPSASTSSPSAVTICRPARRPKLACPSRQAKSEMSSPVARKLQRPARAPTAGARSEAGEGMVARGLGEEEPARCALGQAEPGGTGANVRQRTFEEARLVEAGIEVHVRVDQGRAPAGRGDLPQGARLATHVYPRPLRGGRRSKTAARVVAWKLTVAEAAAHITADHHERRAPRLTPNRHVASTPPLSTKARAIRVHGKMCSACLGGRRHPRAASVWQAFTETSVGFVHAAGRLADGGAPRYGRPAADGRERGAMKIAMIGTGYVGLVSGVCFSDFGHEVVCVDKDPSKIELLKAGRGADLRAGPRRADGAQRRGAGGSSFTGDLAAAVDGADAVFIAVGTPTRRGDGHADLSYVFAAAEEIAARADRLRRRRHQVDGARRHQRSGSRDIIREARPDGRVRRRLEPRVPARGRGDRRLHAPRPRGRRRRDPSAPAEVMAELYRPLFLRDFPDRDDRHRQSAEMIKYAANAFLATKITFINEIAMLCERVGADVKEVAKRHRPRRPHRQQVPARRPRLRRLVLSQGHQRARPHRPGARRADAHHRDGDRGQRRASSGGWSTRSSTSAAARSTARRSRCSASPSSPTPTTCATRRR